MHLVLELAVTETQAKAGRPAHFVNVQNLLDDPLQKNVIYIMKCTQALTHLSHGLSTKYQ